MDRPCCCDGQGATNRLRCMRRSPSILSKQVEGSISIDWNYKTSLKAEMRAKVRRLLAKYGYQPDLEANLVELAFKQSELFANNGTGECHGRS
jgi:hypothetical protein